MRHDRTHWENMISGKNSIPVWELIVSCIIHLCIFALLLFVWTAPVKDHRISALTVRLFGPTNAGSTAGAKSAEVSSAPSKKEQKKRTIEQTKEQSNVVKKENTKMEAVPDPLPGKGALGIFRPITTEEVRIDNDLADPELDFSQMESPVVQQESGHYDGEAGDKTGTGQPGAAGSFGTDGLIVDAEFGETDGPRFLRRVEPAYPLMARKLGKEGRVLLRLIIDGTGKLMEIEVVERAGFGFEGAAVEAVRQSSFRPAFRNGRSVTSRSLLAVKFVLKDG